MDKWIVNNRINLALYDNTTNNWDWFDYEGASDKLIESALENGEATIEIAIVKESNKHGQESYGWADQDKIILFKNTQFNSKKEIEWAKKVAKTIADALNEKGL